MRSRDIPTYLQGLAEELEDGPGDEPSGFKNTRVQIKSAEWWRVAKYVDFWNYPKDRLPISVDELELIRKSINSANTQFRLQSIPDNVRVTNKVYKKKNQREIVERSGDDEED